MSLTASDRSDIASGALADARDMQDEADRVDAEIENASLEELIAIMQEMGVDVDLDAIEAEARAALGTDAGLLNRGASLSAEKRADLEGRMVKAARKIARTATRDVIRQARAKAFQEADDRPDDERMMMWVSVGDDGTCATCEDRHGYVLPAVMWEGEEPGHGTTLCRKNCRCTLVPVGGGPDITKTNIFETGRAAVGPIDKRF